MSELYTNISELKLTMEDGDVKLYATMEQLAELHQLAVTKAGRKEIVKEIVNWISAYGSRETKEALVAAIQESLTNKEIAELREELEE